jgi:hypothetical protein
MAVEAGRNLLARRLNCYESVKENEYERKYGNKKTVLVP